MSREMGRRAFLGALPAAVVAGRSLPGGSVALAVDSRGTPSSSRPAASRTAADAGKPSRRAIDGLGVQLYTLRAELADDVDRTLAAVAEIGYHEVELAGLYGLTPRQMRSKVDDVGLRAVSGHFSVAEIRGEWTRALEGAQELGQALVVVPSIPGSERTPEGLRRVADDFNRAAEAARSVGLRFGYHNHDWEFGLLSDGTIPMDLLLERTADDLVDWQMDVFWVVHGGAEPASYLEQTRGRVTSVHVKDRTAGGEMVDVGDGVIDFASLLRLAEPLGLLHVFVEHDQPGDGLESVRRSFAHMSALGL